MACFIRWATVVQVRQVIEAETDPLKSAPALRLELIRIFPQLEDVKLSHSWMGLVGFSFDYLPHLGQGKRKKGGNRDQRVYRFGDALATSPRDTDW